MLSIIPSILVHTPAELQARLQLLEKNKVPVVQLDVADHTTVPATTFFDPDFIDSLQPSASFEVHLMTAVNAETIQRWQRPWVQKIIFHLEAATKPRHQLLEIARLGKRAGLALNPETPAAAAKPFLKLIDTLLIMGVIPGRGGQTLLPDTTARLSEARCLFPRGNVEVDGSVNPTTIAALVSAGANLLVVGSALTESNFVLQYQHLTTLANAAFQTRHPQ